MYVDFKVTTWERVQVPTELEDKVREAITSGKATSSSDLYDLFEGISHEFLNEVTEQMSVDNNYGCATIELYEDSSNEIEADWKNGE